jgi:hypothetical protein
MIVFGLKIGFNFISKTLFCETVVVGHGVQREAKEFEELVSTTKRWKLECREEVNGVSKAGKWNVRRRKKELNH